MHRRVIVRGCARKDRKFIGHESRQTIDGGPLATVFSAGVTRRHPSKRTSWPCTSHTHGQLHPCVSLLGLYLAQTTTGAAVGRRHMDLDSQK